MKAGKSSHAISKIDYYTRGKRGHNHLLRFQTKFVSIIEVGLENYKKMLKSFVLA